MTDHVHRWRLAAVEDEGAARQAALDDEHYAVPAACACGAEREFHPYRVEARRKYGRSTVVLNGKNAAASMARARALNATEAALRE